MILRAREVLQKVAVRLGRHDAQIEAQALVREHGRLRLALCDDLVDPGKLDEVLDQRRRILRRGDDVEVAHLLLQAANASRLAHLIGGRMLAKDRDDGAHRGESLAEERPMLDLLSRRRQGAEDGLLRLRAEPGQRSQPLGLGRILQLPERGDPELLPDATRRLRPEPREPHELDDVRGNPIAPLGERRDLAVLDDLHDLLLDHLPDP